jgi:hypothetical protein
MSKALLLELFHSIQERIKQRLPNQYITRLAPAPRSELEKMKLDNASSPHPFKPTGIVWERLSVHVEKRLHIDGLGHVEEQRVNHWFSAVDLFVNIASFQEMTLEQVTEYFAVIDRTTRDALYIQQRYEGDEVSR